MCIKNFWNIAVAISALSVCSLAQAQQKSDIAATGPAKAPVSRHHKSLSFVYSGGSPPSNIVGQFGSDHSTFNRPINCRSISSAGSASPYDIVKLTNRGAGVATLNLRLGAAGNPHATCSRKVDTVMAVYGGFFEPASPLTNCLAVNDDTSATDHCSTLTGIVVPPGDTRFIVMTQYAGGSLLDYELSFDGSVPVTLQSFSID